MLYEEPAVAGDPILALPNVVPNRTTRARAGIELGLRRAVENGALSRASK